MAEAEHVVKKHPLIVRLTHWLNFPVLFVMLWSGLLIYWANDTYWPHFSPEFYDRIGVSSRLAEGMAYHFAFMWIFAINSLIYLVYILSSGYWRELFPNRKTLKEAFQVVLHDLKISSYLPPQERFNAAQRLAYSGIIFLGLVAILSGLAIYKPVQLYFLKNALGGYSFARVIHYIVAACFFLFFFIHIAQVIRGGWAHFRAIVGTTITSLIILVVFFMSSIGVWYWIKNSPQDNGIPVALRRMLQFNERIGESLLSRDRIDVTKMQIPKGKKARVNGLVGLETENSNWELSIVTPQAPGLEPHIVKLKLEDVLALPKKEIRGEFRCIEGWAEFMSFAGPSFRDFLVKYKQGTHSGEAPDWVNRPDDIYKYVGLETPDGQYYVSIDMKSMLNPNTLLAYEQNGEPLSSENGAPLRLYIPNKYGVKNLKRIGKITFSDSPLRDYWGEAGYDWFIGL